MSKTGGSCSGGGIQLRGRWRSLFLLYFPAISRLSHGISRLSHGYLTVISRLSHGYLSFISRLSRLSCGYPFYLGTTQETKRPLSCDVCVHRAAAVGGGGVALQPPTKRIVREEMYLAVRRPRPTRKSERRAREASERRERRSGAAAQRRSGAAAQRRSGAAAQRRSDAQALTTPPSNRSSHSKLAFALVRVSCEIQRGKRASLLLSSAHPCAVCCLLSAVRTQRTTDGGTADRARALRLAPADA